MKLISLLLLIFTTTAFAQIKVVPGRIQGFDNYPDQMERIQAAFKIMEVVINSEEFKKRVIGYQGKSRKGYSANNNLTNSEIYDFLLKESKHWAR